MESAYSDFFTAFGAGIFLFAALLAILWILVPFAVFGVKGRLDRLIAEQRRTNDLIERQAAEIRGYLSRPMP